AGEAKCLAGLRDHLVPGVSLQSPGERGPRGPSEGTRDGEKPPGPGDRPRLPHDLPPDRRAAVGETVAGDNPDPEVARHRGAIPDKPQFRSRRDLDPGFDEPEYVLLACCASGAC